MTPPNLLITASAGTGKTYKLSNRYLNLLQSGVDPAHILATTFTRKAAGEILERILLRIAKGAVDPGQREELSIALNGEALSQSQCYEMLMRVIQNLHRLSISTLDSFFGKVGQCYSFELGLPAGWEIVDEVSDARIRAEAVGALLGQHDKSDLLELLYLLNKGEARRGVAQLVHETVSNLYTLYRETAPEAWQTLPRSRPLDSETLAVVIEDLRECPLPEHKKIVAARNKEYQNACDDDWMTFIGSGIAALVAGGRNLYYKKEIPEATIAIYQRLIDHARAVLVGRLADQTRATRRLLEHFEVHYLRLQHQCRQLRFDDITHCLALAAEAGKASGTFRLGGRLDHLLLDEFQDTALSQWQVLRPLAQRVTTNAGQSFFCVGDTKQAIYGWRGGCADIFDVLPDELEGLSQEPLDKSYRSAPPIIEVVNAIFQNIDKHPNLRDAAPAVLKWTTSFPEHSTAKIEMAGYAALRTAPLADEGESQEETTLQFAAEEVVRLSKESPQFTIGVLVKENVTVADLMNRLRRLRLPASEEGGTPLTDSAAVRTVLSLIRLGDHPGDRVARFHLAHSPLAAEAGCVEWNDDRAARESSQKVRHRLIRDGYGRSIEHWAESLGEACNRREQGRLQQLIDQAYIYQPRATLRGDDFIEQIEQEKVSDPTSARVRVMTVHQAKGLEFDIVVLPELDVRLIGQAPDIVIDRPGATLPVEKVCRYASKELLPLLPPSFQKMHLDMRSRTASETLCVAYVAATRAVHALQMIISPSKKSEKQFPCTVAGLLRAALVGTQQVAPEQVLYEVGDAQWIKKELAARCSIASPAEEELSTKEKREIVLAPPSKQVLRGRKRSTPSSLEGGGRTNLRDLFRRDRTGAAARGTLLHAWFEQIEWLEESLPDEETLRTIGTNLLAPAELIEKALVDFFQCLNMPNVKKQLSRSAYHTSDLEVLNEHAFLVSDSDGLLRGSIDRLVLLRDDGKPSAADIIDFKSDKVSGDMAGWLHTKTDFYRPQLEAYRRAVALMYRLPPETITARLAFIEIDTVVEL